MHDLDLFETAIQGELIGPGIQGNPYNLPGHQFCVFSIYDIFTGEYFGSRRRTRVCTMMGLNHVPVLATDFPLTQHTVDTVLALADGKSIYDCLGKAVIREGLVFKRIDGPEHFKAISNNFLLKEK